MWCKSHDTKMTLTRLVDETKEILSKTQYLEYYNDSDFTLSYLLNMSKNSGLVCVYGSFTFSVGSHEERIRNACNFLQAKAKQGWFDDLF